MRKKSCENGGMPCYPYIYYAEKELLNQLPVTHTAYLSSSIASKEELFYVLYQQLGFEVVPSSYDQLNLLIRDLASKRLESIFLIHDGWFTLPLEDQIAYVSILSQCSMIMDGKRSSLTVLFDLADKKAVENIHQLISKEEYTVDAVGKRACA